MLGIVLIMGFDLTFLERERRECLGHGWEWLRICNWGLDLACNGWRRRNEYYEWHTRNTTSSVNTRIECAFELL